jgi:ABC-type phosphate/phosphonate transport system substrate-binding protein
MKKSLHLVLAVMAVLVLVVSACAPATPAATQPPATQAPTEVPPTEAPATEAPTEAPATEAATAVPPTATPAPPPVCDKLSDAPAAPAAGELGSADNPIVITFVPSGDTGKITTAGTAIADCLSQMTGLSFKMEVGTTFASSIEAMGA